MARTDLHAIRDAVVELFARDASLGSLLVDPGRFDHLGQATGPARVLGFDFDEAPRPVDPAPRLGLRLLSALKADLSFVPGPMAAVLGAYRDGGGIRCLLARSSIDTSTLPTYDFLVVVGGQRQRARIGSARAEVHEIDAGDYVHLVERMSTAALPGARPQMHMPSCVPPERGSYHVALNFPVLLGLPMPSQESLLAWSLRHYGRLPLAEGQSANPLHRDLPPLHPYVASDHRP